MIQRLAARLKAKPAADLRPTSAPRHVELDAFGDPRKMREQWLSHASDFMEQYMRSPAFLDWLHYALTLHNARSIWSGKAPRVTARQGEIVR